MSKFVRIVDDGKFSIMGVEDSFWYYEPFFLLKKKRNKLVIKRENASLRAIYHEDNKADSNQEEFMRYIAIRLEKELSRLDWSLTTRQLPYGDFLSLIDAGCVEKKIEYKLKRQRGKK